MAASSTDYYGRLNDEGYLVVPNVLSSEEISELSASIQSNIAHLIFGRRGISVDPASPETHQLYVDKRKRDTILGAKGSDTVWKNDNSRQPRISKSNGMVNIMYNPEQLNMVTFNQRLYEVTSKVYGTPNLVCRAGPERVSLKAPGATAMTTHIDANLFDDSLNFEDRIQSLVCVSIDTEVETDKSGTLSLLVNFHHYWDFARALFRPKSVGTPGPYPFRRKGTRFFVLPKEWKKHYFPLLIQHIHDYTNYIYHGLQLTGNNKAWYDYWRSQGIVVPREIKPIYWKPIKLNPGDVVYWHQRLPHQSVHNKSSKPRIVVYNSLFPVKPSWYGTDEHKWVVEQFTSAKFYNELSSEDLPTKIINDDEYEDLVKRGLVEERIDICRSTELARKLTGQQSWFS